MSAPARASTEDLLSRSLQYVKGVGPRRFALLQRLLLTTTRDVLLFFPHNHKDRASVTPIARLKMGQEFNVVAQIIDVRGKRFNGKEKVEAVLQDESGTVRASWWNPYIADKLTPNAWAFFSGKVGSFGERRELSSPEFEILNDSEDGEERGVAFTGPSFGRIVPIYNLRPKQRSPDGTPFAEVRLNQNFLRKLVWEALQSGAAGQVPDALPPELRRAHGLMTVSEGIRQYHFPDSFEKVEQARRTLVFEELFMLTLGVALRRAQVEKGAMAKRLVLAPAIEKRIAARLPFQLTAEQAKVFREIAADMGRARPMNRLLQGDVGSGKTAVAVSALLLCVAHGSQAAMLAPTEVLAEQHFRTLTRMLQNSRVNIGLLRGGMKEGERADFLARLAGGDIHIAIGTHALLEENVRFKDLCMVVVDEQHKFGVSQRMKLRKKGNSPHVLVMTATPIPRTLTLTLYGDLEVSSIDAPPPGRGEIVSKFVKEADRAKVYRLMLAEARKGHAAYVVLPRIDEANSDGSTAVQGSSGTRGENGARPGQQKLWNEVKGAEAELKRLREHMPTLRIELLHGRMDSAQKDLALSRLREGKVDVLVSTQVIEVGIDLPNATVMVIENAEMFGLSALHQLRGRVGRSERKSYCFVLGNPTTDDGKQRLKTFVSTRDGFKIAEADFALRGPGQFFGTAQSGMPELKVADLLRDHDILAEARDAAQALVRGDESLSRPEHAALRARVREVFSGKLERVDMG